MAKTNFVNGNPAQGIQGTVVTAEFLNGINNHRHRGLDQDGDGAIDYASDTGVANAYVIALTPALTAHVVGMPIYFMAANANTGASSININGLGVKDIVKNFDQPLAAGDIKAGQIITVAWDGVGYQMISSVSASGPSLSVRSVTNAAVITPNAATDAAVDITAIAQAFTIADPMGTPTNFQKLIIRIKDAGTAQAITWGSAYVAGGAPLPVTTIASKIINIGLIYNTANSLNKWQCVAVSYEA